MNEWLLVVVFFAIALFYSSVGFGGGSSYLAILSLVMVNFFAIRSLALLLNILVVSVGTWRFHRKNEFDWKLFWPFVGFSIPMALLGTQLRLSETIFFLILGGALIVAAGFMMIRITQNESRDLSITKRSILGGAIGFLSGIVGIGGGIFLSPSLNLLGWKNARKVAALSSLFILANSITGLVGLTIAGTFEVDWSNSLKLIGAVLLGGLIGSRFSITMNVKFVKLLTAILVLYVGLRLMLNYGFGIKI